MMPVSPIDGKRKLEAMADLPLGLVRALVTVILNWTTQKVRFHNQLDKNTMHHEVERNAQGGFEVRVHFRSARSAEDETSEKHVTVVLPAPFDAPTEPLAMPVDQVTYESLEQAILKHTKETRSYGDDLESFGPAVMALLQTVVGAKDSPWEGLEIQRPRIRFHGDASTQSPRWHNDAPNPHSDEIVTFYVRSNPQNAPLADEEMPRFVRGPVPWMDMLTIGISVLDAIGFSSGTSSASDYMNSDSGPLDSLQSAYSRFIKDGINSRHFVISTWPKRAFVRVSGTFHMGPTPFKKQKGGPESDPRKGRVFISFKTGRTVADSMKPKPFS